MYCLYRGDSKIHNTVVCKSKMQRCRRESLAVTAFSAVKQRYRCRYDCINSGISFGGGEGSRTPVRKRIHKNFSGRSRLFRESCSPRSHHSRQADTPAGQVSFIMRGMGKAYHTHVHHETTPDTRLVVLPGQTAALIRQRKRTYCCSLIYKVPVLRWPGATARYP